MRRLKRSTAFLQCSGDCFRGYEWSRPEPDFARKKSRAQVELSAAKGTLRAYR
jgi:hypothetical protein